jgi:hypothetical protein
MVADGANFVAIRHWCYAERLNELARLTGLEQADHG